MHYPDTYTRVCGILAGKFDVPDERLGPESDLRDGFGFDSLDVVEFHMACEEEFQIEISDEHAEGLLHIDDWVSVIDSLRKPNE